MDIERSPQQSSALLIYQVDPYEIHYLKFILEAYEGLATLTTLDPQKGLIQLAVPPGSKGSLEDLLEALGQELELKRVTTSEIQNPK
jgi:hypothetical protein